MSARPAPNLKPKHGAILVIVLVTMLVTFMLGVALVKKVLIHRQQIQVLNGQQQGLWLAEAGIQRAVRHLADQSDYEGETWEVPADVLGKPRSAQVTIEVTTQRDQPEVREIRVAVVLNDDRATSSGYQREYQYRMPTKESKESSEQSEDKTAG